ncbi:MAG: biotin--[acetyl-CoA-carboxylase] ligase [Candidatus Latescibacterota bacterium]
MPVEFLPPQWHDSLPSTNTWLHDRLRAGVELPAGCVLAARQQTAGRGRQGRSWVSSPGRDLTFSFLVRPRVAAPGLLSLPMAVALGVVDVLADLGVAGQTRWPNDVHVQGRKVCGILAEGHGGALVVGVGLNVNMDAAEAASIDRPATSVQIETGREWPLEPLLARLLQAIAARLEAWERGGFAALREDWLGACAGLGEPVEAEGLRGRLEGFGEHGEALVRLADGGLRRVWSGELLA